MRGRLPLGFLVGAALLLALGAAGVVWARTNGGAADTARLVPAEAVVYAAVNTDATSRQWVLTAKLLKRLGLDDTARQARDRGAREAELRWEEDIAPFLGGEAAMAVLGADAVEPQALVILATRDGGRAWQKAVQAAEKQAQGQGPETRTHRGVEIRVYAGASPLAIARSGRYLLLATGPELIEQALDRGAGHGDSLAGLERFKRARAAVAEDPLLFVYVNPETAVKLAREGLAESLPPGVDLDQALHAGALEESALAFALTAEEKGVRLEAQVVGIEGPRAAPLMPPAPAESRFARRAPADTVLFLWGAGLYDGSAFSVKELRERLRRQDPSGELAGVLDTTLARLNRELGVDVESELLKQLTGEYAVAVGARAPDADEAWGLLMAGVREPARVERVLARVAQYEQRQGRNIGRVDLGGVTLTESRARRNGPVQWAYVVAGDELLLGIGPEATRRAVERRETLADDPDFREARSLLPDERTLGIYLSLSRVLALARQTDTGGERLTAEGLAHLRYVVAGVVQKRDRAGLVAFLRIAE